MISGYPGRASTSDLAVAAAQGGQVRRDYRELTVAAASRLPRPESGRDHQVVLDGGNARRGRGRSPGGGRLLQ
jgi:hypothetical protein